MGTLQHKFLYLFEWQKIAGKIQGMSSLKIACVSVAVPTASTHQKFSTLGSWVAVIEMICKRVDGMVAI